MGLSPPGDEQIFAVSIDERVIGVKGLGLALTFWEADDKRGKTTTGP